VIVADASHGRRAPGADDTSTHSVMVRVDDLDAHYQRTLSAGAGVLAEPADHPYGERQYAAVDGSPPARRTGASSASHPVRPPEPPPQTDEIDLSGQPRPLSPPPTPVG
jgi:hypothetical protein